MSLQDYLAITQSYFFTYNDLKPIRGVDPNLDNNRKRRMCKKSYTDIDKVKSDMYIEGKGRHIDIYC